jgi:U3 small nucleolar RNA-associated protein 6
MVDELDDLERREIFTRAEIAEIVKQRRKFEYRLKRPSPLKEDFIAYIDYEVKLDELRQLRRKSVARVTKKRKKKSVSDFAGVARIVEIYRLATMRYKGDINLWFRYLEFCKQKRHGRMKKALAQAIRFHPKVAGVWIYAASWEFDRNLNVTAARALMLNGLRVCSNSEDLWVEYLRMELTFLNKLKARKVALGEDKGSLVRDTKTVEDEQWKDENKELFMSLDEKEGNEKEENDEDSIVEDVEDVTEKVDFLKEKGSNVLQTIYSGAVEAIPSSFDLRKRFLEILEATDLAHSDEMRNTILSDLKRDFCNEPEYWNWLARHEMSGCISNEAGLEFANPQMQKAIQVFEEGLQTVTSSSMFEIYINFLMEAIVQSNGDENEISSLSNPIISHIINVYQKADETGCLTEELADEYVSLYLKLEKTHEAQKLAEKLCSEKFAGSAKLWLSRVSIEIRSLSENSSPSKADFQTVFELLSNALRKVPISESESLWLMAFNFFAHQRTYLDKLVEMSILSATKSHGSDHVFSLASTVVKFVLETKGAHSARKIYKRFLALPGPSLVLYKGCIEIETNLISVGDKDGLSNARKLYDSAVASYGQDVELWKNYYSLETKVKWILNTLTKTNTMT